MSLQFSVSKNGPPNNTNKINKRITEYNDILRWKGVEGPSENLWSTFLFRLIEKKLTI